MKYPVFLDFTAYSLVELYHVSEVSAATFVKVCCTLEDVMSQKTASFLVPTVDACFYPSCC
jgi:hypothetical protein